MAWDVMSGVTKTAWGVMSGVTKTAWGVMSGVTKTAWDVLSGVANLCGMFCPGCQKMAWDVLSRDVLSGSLNLYFNKAINVNHFYTEKCTKYNISAQNTPKGLL